MKVFGIASLIVSIIFFAIIFVSTIGSWFKRDKEGFEAGVLSALTYALWCATAICLIIASC